MNIDGECESLKVGNYNLINTNPYSDEMNYPYTNALKIYKNQ